MVAEVQVTEAQGGNRRRRSVPAKAVFSQQLTRRHLMSAEKLDPAQFHSIQEDSSPQAAAHLGLGVWIGVASGAGLLAVVVAVMVLLLVLKRNN